MSREISNLSPIVDNRRVDSECGLSVDIRGLEASEGWCRRHFGDTNALTFSNPPNLASESILGTLPPDPYTVESVVVLFSSATSRLQLSCHEIQHKSAPAA
jgi:hypothetical protein